jgi:pantothenate kinase
MAASIVRYDIAALAERARQLVADGRRRVLGICGAPGAGKSTLAAALVEALGGDAVVAPMDGFHLANAELDRLGVRGRKGAPFTFDAAGYVAMLRRVAHPTDGAQATIYWPRFDRALDEPIAGAIAVPPDVALVVTEGNYLLLGDEPWRQVGELLAEAWYVEIDDRVRRERLVARHVEFGRSLAEARRHCDESDELNARLVAATRAAADLVTTVG